MLGSQQQPADDYDDVIDPSTSMRMRMSVTSSSAEQVVVKDDEDGDDVTPTTNYFR